LSAVIIFGLIISPPSAAITFVFSVDIFMLYYFRISFKWWRFLCRSLSVSANRTWSSANKTVAMVHLVLI
jgi:hypothetical protein